MHDRSTGINRSFERTLLPPLPPPGHAYMYAWRWEKLEPGSHLLKHSCDHECGTEDVFTADVPELYLSRVHTAIA